MKPIVLLSTLTLAIAACQHKQTDLKAATPTASSLNGTWRLVSDKNITKGDTVVTYPDKTNETEMIKVYNDSHFAFFQHDLTKGKTKPFYSSGAGTYKLNGEDYSEHLAYCDAREWENRDFNFKLSIHNDTLVQKGIERIDSLNVNRVIIETYVKVK